MAMLVKSKALTVQDVAAIGEKLCQIDVDTFSALLSSPAVVGVYICHPYSTNTKCSLFQLLHTQSMLIHGVWNQKHVNRA